MSAAQSLVRAMAAQIASSTITATALQVRKTVNGDFKRQSLLVGGVAPHRRRSRREASGASSDNRGMTDPDSPLPAQPRNPLHGLTLEAIVTALVETYGWQGLDERIPLRCFAFEPSIKSSLKFLRKTPWAREKVEGLYLFMLREQRRDEQGRWRG